MSLGILIGSGVVAILSLGAAATLGPEKKKVKYIGLAIAFLATVFIIMGVSM